MRLGISEVVRLHDDEAHFVQIPWTGRNRASARRSAANEIADRVAKMRTERPREKLFLIGHSHGGSAIAYFLKEHPEAVKVICGCAFLSTPFVAIRPRLHIMRIVATFAFLFSVAAFVWFQGITRRAHLPTDMVDVLTGRWLYWIGGVLVISAVSASVYLRARVRMRKAIRELVTETVRQQTTDIPDGNFLFLRCSGDEAAAGLSALQFIAWLGTKVSRGLERLVRPLFHSSTIVRYAYYYAVLTLTSYIATLLFWPEVSGLSKFIAPTFVDIFTDIYSGGGKYSISQILAYLTIVGFIIPTTFATWLLCFALGAAIAVLLAQATASWFFGWTQFLAGFVVELAIEPLPFGTHTLVHIDWNTSAQLDGMVHSWTYAHPDAVRFVQAWVQRTLVIC
jgi:pimeloyl-ACP methyl ester carboxylesterase